MDGDAVAASLRAGGYFSGSSVTMTTRLAPSAATCARDLRHGEAAVVRLAAGHRDRVVEQDLVGDVGAGRDRGADRQVAGVVVGAVAEVLEHVRALGERRLADPVGALAAHLGEARGVAVHPLHHVVAADAGIGAHALGHDGRRIVRAAGAEIRNARGDVGGLREHALRLLQPRDAAGELLVRACAPGAARRCRSRCRWDRARPSAGTASCRARPSCRCRSAG